MSNDVNSPLAHKQISQSRQFVDTRTLMQQFGDGAKDTIFQQLLIFIPTVICFFVPWLSVIGLPIIIIVSLTNYLSKSNKTLPVKLPKDLFPKSTDYNAPKIGLMAGFKKAAGTVYYGICRLTLREVWLSIEDFLTHLLFLATTGGGKSEGLLSLVGSVSISSGGSVLYLDAKAGVDLSTKFITMARLVGREDQVRIVNYNRGGTDEFRNTYTKITNNTSPFALAPPDICVQLIEGTMPEAGDSNGVFKDKAITTLNAIFPCVCELRDKRIINITPSLIAEFSSIKVMCQIAYPQYFNNQITFRRFGDKEDSVIPNEVEFLTREAVRMFLTKLPAFSEEEDKVKNPHKQDSQVEKQFGFGEGYFMKALAQLSATYGHIFDCELGEADFADCIYQNRLFLLMIPATQASKDTRKMLGKINLTAIRIAISLGLGDYVEGDIHEIIDNLPVDKQVPSLLVADEYPEAAVPGFSIAATQGRSLGICCCFSGQEFAGFISADKDEADQIFGNTVIKAVGKILEPEATLNKLKGLAETVRLAESGGWDKGFFNNYQRDYRTSIKEVESLNIDTLQKQDTGQVHLLYQGKTHLVQLFHHGVDMYEAKNIRLVRMLPIPSPLGPEWEKTHAASTNAVNINSTLEQLRDFMPLEYFDGIEITDGNGWIKQLLLSDNGLTRSPGAEYTNLTVANDTPPAVEREQVEGAEESELEGLSVAEIVEAAKQSNQVGVIDTTEEKTSTTEKQNTPTKTQPTTEPKKSFSWVFGYETDDGVTAEAATLKGLAALSDSLGANKEEAEQIAAETIDRIISNTQYTSKQVSESAKDFSVLYDEIHKLQEAT